MNSSEFQYIFTDGLDKLLSASIWLPLYGGNNAFVYYHEDKLKGYVSSKEIDRLAKIGESLFLNQTSRKEYIHQAHKFQSDFNQLPPLTSITSSSPDTLQILLNQYCNYLQQTYGHYFLSEEFYTRKLNPDHDLLIINQIGAIRLQLIEKCISATEIIYHLAKQLINSQSYIKDQELFLTINELKNGQYQQIDPNVIKQRQQAFILSQTNTQLTLAIGNHAIKQFEYLCPNPVTSKFVSMLSGMAASKGTTTGPVYKILLSDQNVSQKIKNMPPGTILVTESTQPSLLLACQKAIGIITDEGGVLSHAAIIARELKIPCVVGTRNATEVLKNNQTVTVNGITGIVQISQPNSHP